MAQPRKGATEGDSDAFFPFKDSREEAVLGSIPLPSYVISPVAPEDRISRKYSFKVLPPPLQGCSSILTNSMFLKMSS